MRHPPRPVSAALVTRRNRRKRQVRHLPCRIEVDIHLLQGRERLACAVAEAHCVAVWLSAGNQVPAPAVPAEEVGGESAAGAVRHLRSVVRVADDVPVASLVDPHLRMDIHHAVSRQDL